MKSVGIAVSQNKIYFLSGCKQFILKSKSDGEQAHQKNGAKWDFHETGQES
jgi:hypothetical protein